MSDDLVISRTRDEFGTTRERLLKHLQTQHWFEQWQLAGKSDSELERLHHGAHHKSAMRVQHQHERQIRIIGDEASLSGFEDQGKVTADHCRSIADARSVPPAIVWQQAITISQTMRVDPAALVAWWADNL